VETEKDNEGSRRHRCETRRNQSAPPRGTSYPATENTSEWGDRWARAVERAVAAVMPSSGTQLGCQTRIGTGLRGILKCTEEVSSTTACGQLRSGPRTVVKSTSVFACSEPLVGQCFCLKKQNSSAKNRSTRLDSLLEPIPCEVVAHLCLREHESCLPPLIAPASRAIDASPSLSLSRRVRCICLMLCLSFYECRCIDAGEQIILAPFLGRTSRDRAPGRFADFLFDPKHEKADVLLTTNMSPVRWVNISMESIARAVDSLWTLLPNGKNVLNSTPTRSRVARSSKWNSKEGRVDQIEPTLCALCQETLRTAQRRAV